MAEFPPTRASLLLRLRDRRDAAAWAEFVGRYAPPVYGYLRKQGLQDADAADLTQDALAALLAPVRRLEYDPARGAFRNGLFTVVRRKLANWRASRANRLRGSGDTDAQRLLEEEPAPEDEEAEWQAEWEQQVFTRACEQVRRDVTAVTW